MSEPVRVLPHDLLAERSVLGAVLVQPDLFDAAEGVGLRATHFFREGHQRLWQAYATLRAQGVVLDVVTLKALLERETVGHGSALDEVGGLAYVAGLSEGVPKAVNVEGYAAIVREHHQRRSLIFQAQQTISEAYAAGPVDELLDGAESRLMAVGATQAGGEFVFASEWMHEMFSAVSKAAEERRLVTGIPTGFAELDRLTRGWQNGDLIIIAGRPSDGKTALAMQLANEASRHAFVAVCSLEMSRRSVGFRLVALEARVDAFRMMTGQLGSREIGQVSAAMERLAERRLAIDDSSSLTVAALCAKLRRLSARYGKGLVIVDYLQLLSATGAENRTQEIAQISGRLKALAKELAVPVIVLSQLNREAAKGGPTSLPQLHQLRDGGAIEADADVALLLHRPNKQTESGRFQDNELVQLVLAKQRNGPANRVLDLYWQAAMMRFAEVTQEPQQPVQERLA